VRAVKLCTNKILQFLTEGAGERKLTSVGIKTAKRWLFFLALTLSCEANVHWTGTFPCGRFLKVECKLRYRRKVRWEIMNIGAITAEKLEGTSRGVGRGVAPAHADFFRFPHPIPVSTISSIYSSPLSLLLKSS